MSDFPAIDDDAYKEGFSGFVKGVSLRAVLERFAKAEQTARETGDDGAVEKAGSYALGFADALVASVRRIAQ